MLEDNIAGAISRAYNQLNFMSEDIYTVHGFAYWPIAILDTEKISTGSKSGPRSPGHGDEPARTAYSMVAQDLARAYFEMFKVAINTSIEVPLWRAAETLVPVMSGIPSPSELTQGCEVMSISLIRLAPAGEQLAVYNKNNKLVTGVCYQIEKAANHLADVNNTTDNKRLNEEIAKHKARWTK